jgi:hypothetical protein
LLTLNLSYISNRGKKSEIPRPYEMKLCIKFCEELLKYTNNKSEPKTYLTDKAVIVRNIMQIKELVFHIVYLKACQFLIKNEVGTKGVFG